ncbi:hypothetical protein BDZ97DRAFT_2061824 [Flammula alnicola]|nr:hypothetical protein BDZ97DRAFT_2061824 [Flammula alnicola]
MAVTNCLNNEKRDHVDRGLCSVTSECGPDGNLNLDATNWNWVHCLTLPLETLNKLQFSQHPYKWIRYAIGVVVGARGDLSTSRDALDVVDYDAVLPTESAVIYYHTGDEERRRMFPADPNIGRTFVTSIAERDGNKCLLTGFGAKACDAVHLLPHSKGDTYISTYTQHRSRDDARHDIIQNINSARNGLFLNVVVHRVFGEDVAFLVADGADKQTPNFAMDTTDIDPTATETAKKRFTAHLFKPDQTCLLGDPRLSSGSSVNISDTPDSPPAILFDAVYAGAVLHHFGAQPLKDALAPWKNTFYPSGVMTAAHTESKALSDEQATAAQITEKHRQEYQVRYEAREARHDAREARREARRGPDAFDMLMIMPYIMVPPNEVQAMLSEAREKAEAAEQSHVQEKVDLWRRQVTAAELACNTPSLAEDKVNEPGEYETS